MFFIGQIEDARIEYKAINDFPGLKKLWLSLMDVESEEKIEHPMMPVLVHFAKMLLDNSVSSDDVELNALAKRFHDGIEENQDNNTFCWNLGLDIFNLFSSRKEVPSLRILERIAITYRDDNRYVWAFEEFSWDVEQQYVPASQRQVRRQVSVIEMANEVDCELAGDDAQEIWTCSTEMRPYEDDLTDNTKSFNEMWGKEPVSDPFHYQEWDYQIQLHRPDWTTIYVRRQPRGHVEDIQAIIDEYKPSGASHKTNY
ncbi:Rubisco activation protein CbbO [hydrothermal vent metagenome]|uniref:Rubisco activation protein CbbO n=1 Tax=hydrothermal vent metagenome TaxID=652676 RepID=A0A3B1AJF9_9ZZZZ